MLIFHILLHKYSHAASHLLFTSVIYRDRADVLHEMLIVILNPFKQCSSSCILCLERIKLPVASIGRLVFLLFLQYAKMTNSFSMHFRQGKSLNDYE